MGRSIRGILLLVLGIGALWVAQSPAISEENFSGCVREKYLELQMQQIRNDIANRHPILRRSSPPDLDSIGASARALLEGRPFFFRGTQLDSLASERVQDTLRKTFTSLPNDSLVFFVGNGMQPLYVASKYSSKNKDIADRLKFLPVSRLLLRFTEKGLNPFYEKRMNEMLGRTTRLSTEQLTKSPPSREQLYRYFESIGIGADPKRTIALIDSVSNGKDGAQHSLFQLQEEVIRFLGTKGLSRDEALKKVVPIGIPEEAYSRHSYQVASVSDYLAWTGAHRGKPNAETPYVRLGLSEDVFHISYKAPRWNGFHQHDLLGKYSRFDEMGKPAYEEDQVEFLLRTRQTNPSDYGDVFSARYDYIMFYHGLMERVRR